MQLLSLLISLLLILVSCSSEPEKPEKQRTEPIRSKSTIQRKGCRACHDMQLDPAHNLECTECHKGNNKTGDKAEAHKGLIAHPAHPDSMMQSCGKCHEDLVKNSAHSLHFTLKNEVNLVRTAFGAKQELESLKDIPIVESPDTILDLSDDLLRRRCLRCHVYYSGDRYPATVRGIGCASCHLSFYEGKMLSHSFLKIPGDKQCLQCHYGNYVGADYYGRYEHDMNEEYRTPYTTTNEYFRPFGIEYHQLLPDIHQQRGLTCVDCHDGAELMGQKKTIQSCAKCHDKEKLQQDKPENIIKTGKNRYFLISADDKKKYPVPLMQHPAHKKYNDIAGCQVCHARWAYNDKQTNLMRSDMDEYDDFSRLTVQGSSEIEKILDNNLDYAADEIEPEMSDKINGSISLGLWHKGYVSRRWEEVTIGRDSSGKLQVMRPILDLHLSWVDADEEVRFDAVSANTKANGMLPYIPHTTGKAGLFYEDRIEQFLRSEKGNNR